jgi:hypothetical protein
MIPYISYELSAAVCKPTSQTGSQIRESNNPGLGTTYNVKRAESEPVIRRHVGRVAACSGKASKTSLAPNGLHSR